MTYIPANYSTTAFSFASLVRFFRSHDALSEGKAIQVNDLDWMEMGFINDPMQSGFKPYYLASLKKTPDGKLWLDAVKLKQLQENQIKMSARILMIMGILMVFVAIIMFFTSLITLSAESFFLSLLIGFGGVMLMFLPKMQRY